MSGPTPGVPVEIGGQKRTIRFTNRALMKIEEELGGIGVAGGVRATNVMVWAGLLHEDPTLTLDSVFDQLEPSQYEAAATAVAKAIEIALGKPEANGGPPEGNAPAAG